MANIVQRSGRVNIRVGGSSQESAVMVQNTTNGKLIVRDTNNTNGIVSHSRCISFVELNNAPARIPSIIFKEDLLYMMANISAFTNIRWFLGMEPFNNHDSLLTSCYRYPVQPNKPVSFGHRTRRPTNSWRLSIRIA